MAARHLVPTTEDHRISLLTAYVVGLEGVLARLPETDAKAMFMTASDFAAGLVRVVGAAIDDGVLPAAARTSGKSIHKNFHDGWPSFSIPGAMDLIIQREAFIDWMMREEARMRAHFNRTPVAQHVAHHMDALYEGLGVIERHRGDTRNIRPSRDDRARTQTQQQKFGFNFGMR